MSHGITSTGSQSTNSVPHNPFYNVLNVELVHSSSPRLHIKREQIKELCKKNYEENGRGITILDLQMELRLSKTQAQRSIKYFVGENVLFTSVDLEKQGIHFKGIKRKRPQVYYLYKMKAKIIEDNKKNVLNDTTGYMHHRTHTSIISQQKIQFLHDYLCRISTVLLYIHKLQIKTKIGKENYHLLTHLPKSANARVHSERIGQAQGPPNVEYWIHPNGTIMIYSSCSENPFRLYDESDIAKIMVFLGRVEDRLRYLFSDTRDEIVPSVIDWILKECDVNKDIEIDDIAQVTLPDIQLPLFENGLRAYVKTINDKAYLRAEKSVSPNEPVTMALKNLRKNTDLERDFML